MSGDGAEVADLPPLVAVAFAQLDAAVEELAQLRHSTLSAEELRRTVRGLYERMSRLQAVALRAVRAVDTRDDVVPRARPGTAASAFLRHAVGLHPLQAQRDAATAELLDADTGDLRSLGAAFAAGRTTRGHVDVAVSLHRRLPAAAREQVDGNGQRLIDVVDELVTARATEVSVPELQALTRSLVEQVDPRSPDGAHERRFLSLTWAPDGSLLGRFACGPAQGLLLSAVVEAAAAPRPGGGIDADGVAHDIPDPRTTGQRRMDALVEALEAAGAGASASADPGSDLRQSTPGTGGPRQAPHEPPRKPQEPPREPRDQQVPPEPEGEAVVVRAPGVRIGPCPRVEILVTATVDQLLAATTGSDPPRGGWGPGLARAQQGGPVHPETVGLLACSGLVRRVLLAPSGAVLDVGRAQRLASPAQKRALVARDGGCVVPGCAVPGEQCDVHHAVPWSAGGVTDLANLALVCPRHHTEIHEGTWALEVIAGMPWVRVPAWVHPDRPLLRNTVHRHAPVRRAA
jgi:hypothetical protein